MILYYKRKSTFFLVSKNIRLVIQESEMIFRKENVYLEREKRRESERGIGYRLHASLLLLLNSAEKDPLSPDDSS